MSHPLPVLGIGPALSVDGLTVFPIFTEARWGPPYRLAPDALDAETAVVEEVSASGSVPELQVVNAGDEPVLFLEGESLIGAKQNRMLNTTVMVGAGTSIRIPVSCVEEGRWSHVRRRVGSSPHHSPSSLRYVLRQSVALRVESGAGHTCDQRAVWSEVRRKERALGTSSATHALDETYGTFSETLAHYERALPYVAGATGLATVVGDRLAGLDLFDRPETCESAWPRLLTGYALDALEHRSDPPPAEPYVLETLLASCARATWTPTDGVGEGQELRAQGADGTQGFALVVDGRLVHASVLAPASIG